MDVGLLSSNDSNHACVSSEVVHTSRLGPAARYRGMRAVSMGARKRRAVAGMVGLDTVEFDARITSGTN
jgi:hypothetical protein